MAADEYGIDWDAAVSQRLKEQEQQKKAAPKEVTDWAGLVSQHQEAQRSASTIPVDPPGPAAPTPQEDGEEGGSGLLSDVLLHGVAGGVEQAARGAYATVKGGVEAVGGHLPDLGEPVIGKPEGITAQITRDMTQFGLGFVGGMGLLKGVGVAQKLAPVVKEIAASGLGTGVVADPTAPRLSNLIQKYPWLENPVTEYLSQDDKDGVLESKFKATLEDMMTTPAAMALFKAVKGMKNAMSGNEAGAKQMAEELSKDAAQASVRPNASTSGDEFLYHGASPKGAAAIKKQGFFSNPNGVTHFTANKEDAEFYAKKTGGEVLRARKDAFPPGAQHLSGWYKTNPWEKIPLHQDAPELNAAVSPQDLDLSKAKAANDDSMETIKSPSGQPVFSLSKDEAKAFDAHLHYLVSNDRLEDVFNFPAFKSFNDSRSSALPETKDVVDAMSIYLTPRLNKFMGEKETHQLVERTADFLGEDPKVLVAKAQSLMPHLADLPGTLVALKALTYSTARDARRLATKIRFETATPEDHAALAQVQKRFADVLGMTQTIRKAAARTTSAGRIETGEKDVQELTNLLSLTKDEKEAVAIMKDKSLMGKLIDAHNEVWINGILSGVKTHVINLASASTNSLLTPGQLMVGGLITRDHNAVREGFALYRGLYRHIFDSLEMAGRSMKTERAVLDPGKSTDETMEKAISSKNFPTIGRFADWLGTAARIPGRFLKSEDEFFKQMNYRAKVEANASREASNLVAAGKLDPNKMVEMPDGTKLGEVEKYIHDKFQSAFSPDGVGLDKSAIDYARQVTFTQDLNAIKTYDWFGTSGNLGANIQRLASSHPWLRGTVLPFIKVPTNIMRLATDMTPLAFLKKEGMDILTDPNVDPAKRALFLGRVTTGSMMSLGAAMLALQGRITGSAYGDKEMRARQLESGWQPYSFVFKNPDGTNKYVSFQRLDPYGMFFGLAADITYLQQHVDASTGHNLATMLSLAVAKNLASKSYLQGLVEMSSMIGGGYTAEEQAARLLQMKTGSYVPNYMTLYNGDDELKNVRSAVDAIMAKTPGLSSTVEAKRDYFGQKRVAPMGYPWSAIDPFPISNDKDAVRSELARLSRSQSETRFEMPNTKVGNIDMTQLKNKDGRSAYDMWTEKIGTTEIGGKNFHDRLKDVISSDRYKEGSDGTSAYHAGSRAIQIKNWQQKYREKALRETLAEFDNGHLKSMVRQDKRNANAVRHGREDRIQDLLKLAE